MKLLVAQEGGELVLGGPAGGHQKPPPTSMFCVGLNRAIHLNRSSARSALVACDFLFAKMTSTSFHQQTSLKGEVETTENHREHLLSSRNIQLLHTRSRTYTDI